MNKALKVFNKVSKFLISNEKINWLVSYPRSGNTWIRLILANYIWNCPKINNLNDLQKFVPDIYFRTPNITTRSFQHGHRIFKSHEPYRADYARLIYVFRKPFDCAWSYFHFINEWKGVHISFNDFIYDFLNGNFPYGSWRDHLVNWNKLHQGTSIFITYENLTNKPLTCIGSILTYLEINLEEEKVKGSIEKASPQIISKITNDKKFYGKEFISFVKTPLGIDIDNKEELRSKYKSKFDEWDTLYLKFENDSVK